MNPEANPNFDGHEQIVEINDDALGFSALIAIHNTVLGPAGGGCRVYAYANPEAALTDALRLSRGMTYKNAMADLPMGGGKAVIYRTAADRAAMFEKFGEAVEALSGRYITAEDVGATMQDMQNVAKHTRYVSGVPRQSAHAGGDPAPWTALGVLVSMRAMAGDLKGKRVAVQGVGAVGHHLCQLLTQDGAKLVVADVNADRVARAAALGAETAPADRIHAVKADVFAPCALGAGLNAQTIPELGAPIICGAANNQLATEADGERLVQRGIAYGPDYVVNAGGIINVSAEYLGESADLVETRVRAIAGRVRVVMDNAKREGVPPGVAADRIVRQKLAAASAQKTMGRP